MINRDHAVNPRAGRSPRRWRTLFAGALSLTSVIASAVPVGSLAATSPAPWQQPPLVDLPTNYQKPLAPPADARGPAPDPQLPADEQAWTALAHTVHGPGSDTAQLFGAPMFRPGSAEGRWQAVDAWVGAGTAAGDAASAPDHVVPVHLGSNLAQVVSLSAPGGAITVGVGGVAGSSAAANVDGVSYTGDPLATVTSHVTRDGVHLDVARLAGNAPTSLTLTVADAGHQLGAASLQPDGSVAFAQTINGAGLAVAAAMARGSTSRDASAVALSASTAAGGTTITVTAPAATGATAATPSTLGIDLSLTSAQHGVSGTVTLAGDACTACTLSAAGVLNATAQPDPQDGALVQRGVVGFDTSSLPGGAVIDSATLTAHVIACAGVACAQGADVEVHALNGLVGPSSKASAIAAMTGGSVATQHVAPAATTVTWDVASLVQRWVNGTARNTGVTLQAADEHGLSGGFSFAGPGVSDGTMVPELDVTYHTAAVAESDATPLPPSAVSVVTGTSSALVTWTPPPTQPGNPIVSSLVTLSDTDANTSQSVITHDSSAWFFGLVAGHHLTVSVWSQTGGARSDTAATASAAVATAVPPSLVPSAPGGLAASAGAAGVQVRWTSPVNSVALGVARYDVTGYDVAGNVVSSQVACSACTSVVLRGAGALITSIGITASSSFGTTSTEARVALAPAHAVTPAAPSLSSISPVSATVNASGGVAIPLLPETGGPTVPGAPGSVTGTPGKNIATITWTAAANGGATITAYTVQAYTSSGSAVGGTVQVCGTCLTATMTGLTNGSSYYATVYATNSVGNGPTAQSNTFILNAPPSVQKYTRTLASDNSIPYSRGVEIGFGLKIFNPQTVSMSVTSGKDTLDSGYVPELNLTLDSTDFTNGPFCTTTSTPSCTLAGDGTMTIGSFTLAAGATHAFRYYTVVNGNERGCVKDRSSFSATNDYGTGTDSSQAPILCDAGLGSYPWFTTTSWPAGPQGAVTLNVGDGNAVVTQNDSTSVPLHGDLTLGMHRAYNSIALGSATGAGMLGSGWWLTFDDGASVAQGLTAAGLFLPTDEAVARPLPVTVVTADGGRSVFPLVQLATPIDVTALQAANSTGPLAVTIPRALTLDGTYTRICVDQVAGPPMGVHASLWRYVEVTSSNSTCARSSWLTSTILGYAAERVDRIRYEFASDGHKLDTQDANANEIRVHYVNDPPSAGKAMGNLSSVVEPATGRSLTFAYTTGTPNNELDVTDVAHRVTKYFTNATSGLLVTVTNPDSTQLQYVYGGCTAASATQLCSASDPISSTVKTQLTYTQTSSNGTTYLGPAQVASVTDRRGTVTTFAYNTSTGVATLSDPGRNRVYSSFDPFNDAGEIDVVDPSSGLKVTQTFLFWDNTYGGTCIQPNWVPDHKLCSTVTQSFSSASDTKYTKYRYGEEGQLLRTEDCAAMTDFTSRGSGHDCTGEFLDATSGTHAIYIDASGSTATYDDLPSGGGSVSSPNGPGTGGARWMPTTLYALVDGTQSLPPRANLSGLSTAQWQSYLSTIALDNSASFAPNQHGASGVCTAPGTPTGNTGDICQVQGPQYDGSHNAITQMHYLPTGEVSAKASALAIARNPSSPAMTAYTYYGDTATDLSNTTKAGGWLEAVTDPTDGTGTGGFTVFAYDAAGNVARTWDRDATAGTLLSSYPGTISAPPNAAYIETLRATGSTAYSAPGRFVLSQRDQLGNLTTFTVDADGNHTTIRPPRGNQAGNATYDVTQSFDANGDMVCSIQPVEAGGTVCNASGTRINGATQTLYDARGNATQVTDPVGNVAVATVDAANRKTKTTWIRGWNYSDTRSPYYGSSFPAPVPANCPVLGTADGPFPAGSIECHTTTTYDGTGAAIAVTDGDGGQTQSTYDPQQHVLSTLVERLAANPIVWGRTDNVYDEDGNVTRTCPPNSFANGTTSCATSTSAYDTASTYDVNDRVSTTVTCRTTCTSPTIYTSSYTYDADGNKVTATDPRGTTTTVAYNLLDRKTSSSYTRSGTAITTTWTYSAAGDVVDAVDASGKITATSYDAAHRKVDVVDGSDNMSAVSAGALAANGGQNIRTRTFYDADGHVIEVLQPGAFTSVSSPDTRFQTRSDYDNDGRATATWTPYSDSNDSSKRDPSPTGQCPTGASGYASTVGVCVTKLQYDADGHAISTLLPTAGGNVNSPRHVDVVYTPDGLKASTTAPNPTGSGTVKAYAFYDASGRTVKTLDGVGTPDVTTYSPDSLVTQHSAEPEQNQQGVTSVWHCETMAYDANGNRTSDSKWLDPNQPASGCSSTPLTETWTYSTDNLQMSDTDAGGNVTSWTRDQAGNPIQVMSPSANAGDPNNSSHTPTTNTYTEDNLLASTTVPITADGTQRRQTSFTYKPFGSKASQTVNTVNGSGGVITAGGTQSYAYYADERLNTTTGRNNEVVTDQYDGAGRPTSIVYTSPSQSTSNVTASYYLNEALISAGENIPGLTGAAYGYSYDGAGSLAYHSTGGYTGHTITYSRNDAGLVTSASDADLGAWSWSYDAAGRVAQQINPNNTNTVYHWNTDNTISVLDPYDTGYNGSYTWSYDSLYRLKSTYFVGAQPTGGYLFTSSDTYQYDNSGRISNFVHTLTTQAPGGGSDTLTFNGTYDHNGNRLSWGSTTTSADSQQTATYNADDSIQTEKIGITSSNANGTQTSTYAYSVSGSNLSDGCRNMSYDGFDQMTSASPAGGNQCGASASASFYYDGLHRQIGRTDGPYNLLTAIYHDGLSNNLSMQQQQWLPNVYNRDDYYALAPDGTALADQFGALSGGFRKSEYYTYDQHRNPIRVTWSNGNVLAAPLTDPFGAPLNDQPSASFPSPEQQSTQDGEVGFKGFQQDHGSRLQHVGIRDYNPRTGTWVQTDRFVDDPTGNFDRTLAEGAVPGMHNFHSFGNGDPVNNWDPTGHVGECRFGPDCQDTQGEPTSSGASEASNAVAQSEPGYSGLPSQQPYGSTTVPVSNQNPRPLPTIPPNLPPPPHTHLQNVNPDEPDANAAVANASDKSVNVLCVVRASAQSPCAQVWADTRQAENYCTTYLSMQTGPEAGRCIRIGTTTTDIDPNSRDFREFAFCLQAAMARPGPCNFTDTLDVGGLVQAIIAVIPGDVIGDGIDLFAGALRGARTVADGVSAVRGPMVLGDGARAAGWLGKGSSKFSVISDLPGGTQGAQDLFRALTGKLPAAPYVNQMVGDFRIVYRATSSTSGGAVVEITDNAYDMLEKIHFVSGR